VGAPTKRKRPSVGALQMASSRILDVGTTSYLDGAPPFLSEIIPCHGGFWACESFFPRVFLISRDFKIQRFDFHDGSWASNLVSVADGSLYCVLKVPDPPTTPRAYLGRISTRGEFSRVHSPNGQQLSSIARLGLDQIVATQPGAPDFFVSRGDNLERLSNLSGASGEPVYLTTASDGSLWYVRTGQPAKLGRLDHFGRCTETSLVINGKPFEVDQPVAYVHGSILIPSGNGSDKEICIARPVGSGIKASVISDGDFALRTGTFDTKHRLWFYDDSSRLSVASIDPLERIAVSSNITPIGSRFQVLAPDGSGVIALAGASAKRYALV